MVLSLSKLGADFSTQPTEDLFRIYDSVWIHYKTVVHPTQLAMWRAHYGTQIVLDVDDTWKIPLNHPSYKTVSESARWSKYFAVVADWVVCSTPEVEEMVKPYNKNTIIIPNRIPYDEGQYHVVHESKESFMNRKIRIGFCGSISHLEDWESISGKLKRVIQDTEVRQKCEFVVCGVPDFNNLPEPDWIEDKINSLIGVKYKDTPENRETLRKSMLKGYVDYNKDVWKKITKALGNPIVINGKPVENYIDLYREIDILLCPLVDNDLNKCKCIEGESFVNTTSGIKKIKDIVNNKLKVYTDENLKVINYFKYENSPTIKIVTKCGYSIEGTYHHKVFVNGNWIQLKNLKIGDSIELKPFNILQKEYQWISYPMMLTKKIIKERELDCDEDMIPKIKITEDWGRFLGYMVGDGHFSNAGLSISCDKRHTNVVEDVTNLIKSMGLYPQYCYKQPDKRCQTLTKKEGNALDIRAASMTFRKIAEKYNWVNEKGKVFEVPEVILNSPKSVIKEFIKGLFEADGCVMDSGILFCSKSQTLIQQLQIILVGFNIKSKVKKQYNKQYRKYYWYLTFGRQGVEIYNKEFGFISEHKQVKLDLICSRKHSGAYKEYTWEDEIVDIEYKTNTVYDIEVEDKHQYNANGIVNHNSSLKVLESACTDTLCILGNLYRGKGQECDHHLYEDWYNNIKSLIKDKEKLYEKKFDISEKIRNLYDYTNDCVLPRQEILGKKKELNLDIYGITYKDGQSTEYKEYRNTVSNAEDKSYFFEANPIRKLYG